MGGGCTFKELKEKIKEKYDFLFSLERYGFSFENSIFKEDNEIFDLKSGDKLRLISLVKKKKGKKKSCHCPPILGLFSFSEKDKDEGTESKLDESVVNSFFCPKENSKNEEDLGSRVQILAR